MQARDNLVLALHVGNIEQIVMHLLRAARLGFHRGRLEWPDGRTVDLRRRDRHQLFLRIAQGRELPTEYTAGIQANRIIEPLRLGDGRVPVCHEGLPSIVRCPVVADGQTKLVRLACGFAVERKGPDSARGTSLHRRGQAGMGHHEPPVVQHIMAHQALEKGDHLFREARRLGRDLVQAFGQPVAELHLVPPERPQELDLVIPRYTQRMSRRGHGHGHTEHVRYARSPINEIAEKDDPAPGRRRDPVVRRAGGVALHGHGVAEAREQGAEFVETSVDIADNVEWAVLGAAIGPEPLPFDGSCLDLLRRRERIDKSEAFSLEATQ